MNWHSGRKLDHGIRKPSTRGAGRRFVALHTTPLKSIAGTPNAPHRKLHGPFRRMPLLFGFERCSHARRSATASHITAIKEIFQLAQLGRAVRMPSVSERFPLRPAKLHAGLVHLRL